MNQTVGLNDSWELSQRLESWAGEIRVNVIRIIAITLFYGRHLIEFLMADKDASVRGPYHLRVTAVVVAWVGVAGVVHVLLSRRYYPPAMKFATSLLDVFMITVLCAIARDPRSPLVLLYFAAIAAAPLRLSLPLIYVTTGATILGYLALLGYYVWYVVGSGLYYSDPSVRIPRSHEIIMLLALLTSGLFAGQVVRQVRRMIDRYPQIHSAQEGKA